MLKIAEYSVRILPEDSIVLDDKRPKITGNAWKIMENTFKGIPLKLPLRARAVSFAQRVKKSTSYSPTYAFLFADKNEITCLVLFRYLILKKDNGFEYVPIYCRCVGKRKLKKHKKLVLSRIFQNYQQILDLKSDAKITFNIY